MILQPAINSCYNQWRYFSDPDISVYRKVAAVVLTPLTAIGALFSGTLVQIRWVASKLFLSKEGQFKEEYQNLVAHDQSCNTRHFKTALANPSRNRFSDVLPNEPTRVQLEGDQYFNANWVFDGKAIACQAPLQSELTIFYQMIKEKKVEKIVTLANPKENGRIKGTDYWSKYVRQTKQIFSLGSVKIVERILRLPNGYEVTQYHLENWPDHGVVSPEVLAKLVLSVGASQGPILVHCSAGIGRTGTFLAAWEAFQTKSRNVYQIALSLRNLYAGRVGSIQNSHQYQLVHETVSKLF